MARNPRMSGSDALSHRLKLGWSSTIAMRARGMMTLGFAALIALSCLSYNPADSSFNTSAPEAPSNLMGRFGATLSDAAIQTLGISAWVWVAVMIFFGLQRTLANDPRAERRQALIRLGGASLGILLLAGALAGPPAPRIWPLATGLGGMLGEVLLQGVSWPFRVIHMGWTRGTASLLLFGLSIPVLMFGFSLAPSKIRSVLLETEASLRPLLDRARTLFPMRPPVAQGNMASSPIRPAREPRPPTEVATENLPPAIDPVDTEETPAVPLALSPGLSIKTPKPVQRESGREEREKQKTFEFAQPGGFVLPELAMLAKAPPRQSAIDEEALRQNAKLLETVLFEFGVKGAIDQIRPGPVVTLYELVPAPGVKHARVVSLSDDIARSMSVAACRVSVVQGRNAIGIELPNVRRETVYLRDLLGSQDYEKAAQNLPMALGETIGGDPYIADLARMPHLLIAGTTGSGKSVGVNAMILSILYRLPPSECRFIMIDPKMLELSVYDGIPHLLAPVVTDPKKAIVALKWTVREMEDRYRRMSKIGVRNIGGFNDRAREALTKGEMFERTVQTGFDESGQPIFETEQLHPETMPYLVVVIDEVADLMMVAGKDIEAAVQRLAQMARAAGIHLIMATQRPSVDVITGTIKANFPTRISFQVTSKIDSRTIMGEQGAEQLLGQGDMLYMAGGGRITRLHGPFVSDAEVEAVAGFLREQGEPQYLEDVTAAPDGDDEGGMGITQESVGNDLYDHAVAIVVRDRKASTSYVQRRLQIGYNRAASLIERMEQEGVVSAANHAGKRDILVPPPGH